MKLIILFILFVSACGRYEIQRECQYDNQMIYEEVDGLKCDVVWHPADLPIFIEIHSFGEEKEKIHKFVSRGQKDLEKRTGINFFSDNHLGANTILRVITTEDLPLEETLGVAALRYFHINGMPFIRRCWIYLLPSYFIDDDSYFDMVINHEIGHCFGLAHSTNEEPSSMNGWSNRLGDREINVLKQIYSYENYSHIYE